MNINKIINVALEKDKESNTVRLPNLDITYSCNSKYVPIFLPAVPKRNLEKFRNDLETQIRDSTKKLVFWSYPSIRYPPGQEYDAVIDLLKVESEEASPQITKTAVLSYHTLAKNKFLNAFLDRIQEVITLNETWDPLKRDPLKSFEEMINSFLQKRYGVTLQQFKGNIDPSKISYYNNRPKHEFETAFAHYTRYYLGSLASLEKHASKSVDFSELEKWTIYPLGKDFRMLHFIREELERISRMDQQ